VGAEALRFGWRPELAWARRLPLRRSEFDALQKIQAFLRDRARNAPIVPLGERSLEIFDDEKRLDALRRNRRLFGPGRLSLEQLRCAAYAPPFVFRTVGTGPIALVLENVATYRSALGTLPANSPVGMVVFGSGSNFAGSVLYFRELLETGEIPGVKEICYFGDLDRPGLEIPITANQVAVEAGLPPVVPAVGLYTRLLRYGKPRPDERVDPECAGRLTSWLPSECREQAAELLINGHRMAQEGVGTELLHTDMSWATRDHLVS
jgi:hypothetical protein